MSMEIYVLSNERLSSIDEWQQAINLEGFALRIAADRSFENLAGYLPAWWKEEQAGFECDHWDAHGLIEECPEVDFRQRWTHALAFRWGADLKACLGAYMAATAYAAATGGVVFDCEEGRIKTPEQARATAREVEADVPMFDARMKEILSKVTTARRGMNSK